MDKKQQLASLLDKSWRIQISDNRVFTGVAKCLDMDLNIILTHTIESKPTEELSEKKTRNVGMVMIPGRHIKRIEVEDLEQ